MDDYSFLSFLCSPDGQVTLETLRSLQAAPTRWLTISEVAERNRYGGHLAVRDKDLRPILEGLVDCGLAQRLLTSQAVKPSDVALDINACCPRRCQTLYACTAAGKALLERFDRMDKALA